METEQIVREVEPHPTLSHHEQREVGLELQATLGFGAVVAHPLRRCPMCGGGEWGLLDTLSTADRASAERS